MTLPFCSQNEKRDENAMVSELLSWAVMDQITGGRGGGGGGEEEGSWRRKNDENTETDGYDYRLFRLQRSGSYQ